MRSTLRVAIFSVFFSALLYSGATYADDTEIFFNTSEVSIRSNLMFVLDNSGSMDAIVETVTPYDPSSTYSGRYSDEYFYFRSGWSYYSIPWAANHCRDLTERLGATGYLSNYRIAVWRSAFLSSARWRSFSTASSSRTSSNLVECEADR